MRRAKPGLKKVANGNKEMFNNFSGLASDIFKDMDMLSNEGETYRMEGKPKLSYLEFVATYDELAYIESENNLPWEQHMEFCKMMYKAWCDGYEAAMA